MDCETDRPVNLKDQRDAERRERAEIRHAHQSSVRRQMARPAGFDRLLRWFLEGFRAEMPEDIHSGGVWRDAPHHDAEGYQPVGGSLIGTPRAAEPFRQLIEDGPYGTERAEYEGHLDQGTHYARPMRAALARLGGRGPKSDVYPFMAIALYRTALRDGDWDSACASLGIIEPVRRPYIEAALHRLYARYDIEPRPATYRPDVQQEAISA
jgi:hypothetical protein